MIHYCALIIEWLHKGTEGELEASSVAVTWLWYFLGGTRTQIQHGTGSFSLCFASVPWHYWITAAEWRHNEESIAGQQGRELWLLSCWVSMTFQFPISISACEGYNQKDACRSSLASRGSATQLLWSWTIPAGTPDQAQFTSCADALLLIGTRKNVLHDWFPDWNWFHNWLCYPDCVSDIPFTKFCHPLSRIMWLWENCQAKENLFT